MKKKGKGLSFDQKRERMLGIFHRTVALFLFRKMSSIIMKLRNSLLRQASLSQM